MGVRSTRRGTAAATLALLFSPHAALALDLPAAGPQPFGGVQAELPALDPAAPFRLQADAATRARAVDCLADAVYYEAAGEPREGREAVAQVVLNRVRHPSYPKSVCGVVFEGAARATGCQFTFTCDGSLRRRPDTAGWREAVQVATLALDGHVASGIGGSTHYHAVRVRPLWSAAMTATRRIGAHQFYRLPGNSGSLLSLASAYSGVEPEVGLASLRVAPGRPSGRTGPSLPTQGAPQQSRFSVWGLTVADLSPQRDGGVSVSTPGAAQ